MLFVFIIAAIMNYNTCAQSSIISWSAFNTGFGISNNSNAELISITGQNFAGVSSNSATSLFSGFMAGSYSILTGVAASGDKLPNEYNLYQNYPNPFNPVTKIKYSIPAVETHRDASVRLEVYDILGRRIASLVNERQKPGDYEVTFDGSGLASGVYFYSLSAGTFHQTKKLILLKEN